MRAVFIALAVAVVPSLRVNAQSPRIDIMQQGLRPSLLRVLANPRQYHHQEIQIIGFLDLAFEGDALYLHQEDLAHNIFANAIWVNATKEMYANKKVLNRKYVLIRGTFDADDLGHMGLFSGAITNITRCAVLSDPKSPLWGGPPPPPPKGYPKGKQP